MKDPTPHTHAHHAHDKKAAVALTSVFAGIALSLTKLVVGLMTGSIGILSEAAHSILDLASATMTYFAVREGDKPADAEHPYGHGKIESVSALIETGLLFVTSMWIVYEAFGRLFGHGKPPEATWYAFAVIIFAIVVDISRAHALKKVADETKSQALAADALHFYSDIFSSLAVLVGLVGLSLGFVWADAIAAIAVAGFVLRAGYALGKQTIDVLVDRAPAGVVERVRALASEVFGVERVDVVRARSLGARTSIEVTVAVSRVHSSEKVRDIARMVKESIEGALEDADALVHATPIRLDNESIAEKIRHLALHHGFTTHDIVIDKAQDRTLISYDLEVPDTFTMKRAHTAVTAVENEILEDLGDGIELNTHIEPLRSASITGEDVDDKTFQTIANAIEELSGDYPELTNIHNIIARTADGRQFVTFHCHADGALSIEKVHDVVTAFELALKMRFPVIKRLVIHAEAEE